MVRVFPRLAGLWCGGPYTHTAPDVSRSYQQRAASLPRPAPGPPLELHQPAHGPVQERQGDMHPVVGQRLDRFRLPIRCPSSAEMLTSPTLPSPKSLPRFFRDSFRDIRLSSGFHALDATA